MERSIFDEASEWTSQSDDSDDTENVIAGDDSDDPNYDEIVDSDFDIKMELIEEHHPDEEDLKCPKSDDDGHIRLKFKSFT